MIRIVVIALCLSFGILLQACSHTQSSGEPVTDVGRPDVLRVTDLSDPTSLNPMLTGADIAYQLSGFVLEYLVQLDDRGNVVPVLAQTVPTADNGGISRDGLTVIYHLRRGVTWSDGQPFTSADVVATWKQVMNPRNNVVDREGYEDIARITTPDPHTFVLHLIRPYPPMPTRFFAAIQEGPVPVMPAHVIASLSELNDAPFSAHPIGTGPFVLQSWIRNGPMTFVANPHYWQGSPGLKEIVFQAQPSDPTELVGFKTHAIDAAFDAGAQRLPSYAGITGMSPIRSKSLRMYLLDMNAGKAPLNDVRVRQAVAFAIDRAGMLHRVHHDAGTLADEWLPAWSWAYTPDVPKYPYDPQKAVSILEAAGWKTGPDGVRQKGPDRLSLVIVGTQGNNAFKSGAELIQTYLKAVGFDVSIKVYPYGIVFDPSGPVKTGKYDLAYFTFSVNYDPSSLDYDGCDRFPPNGLNDMRFCDPVVDRDERLALQTNDPVRRKALYAQIERLRMEDLAGLPLYFPDRVGMVSDRLRNYVPSRGIIPEWNAYLWSLQ